MDKRDKKIIKLLDQNARRPFTEIAEELDLSEAAIRKRVHSLEKKGIIEGYTIKINPKNLGYEAVTILGLDTKPNKLPQVAEKLNSIQEIKEVSICTGDHMIMAKIWAKDNNHLNKIISKKISKIEGIKNLCPAIVMQKVK